MTLSEVAELGRQRLVEQEGRLRVTGIKPYDASAKEAKCRVDAQVKQVSPQTLTEAIDLVLDELANKGEFTMSEPREWVGGNAPTQTACHKDLRITFFDTFDGDAHIWIFCWYHQ